MTYCSRVAIVVPVLVLCIHGLITTDSIAKAIGWSFATAAVSYFVTLNLVGAITNHFMWEMTRGVMAVKSIKLVEDENVQS